MNGLQFLALVVACATIYIYSIQDKLKDSTMTEWPSNKNPILTVMKEEFDPYDKKSNVLSWLFALCDIATDYRFDIPSELEFRQSPFGSDTECHEYQSIKGLLSDNRYIYSRLSFESFRAHVEHALKVLARYDALLRLEGENY